MLWKIGSTFAHHAQFLAPKNIRGHKNSALFHTKDCIILIAQQKITLGKWYSGEIKSLKNV